ncbi:putative transcription factor [Triangularia verruculosa]|uniref:Transcription factor n=1 Tax=Triangularia verruculosa TaxID=2587418 RepID=A0AAN6XDB7_9PEZI|nr:putative transcription factor [Triangularia verruculosa]
MRKRACDACHKRKIQCEPAHPSCDWCKHHGLECTFDREIRPRKRGVSKKPSSAKLSRPSPNASEETLTHKLQRLEALFTDSLNTTNRAGTPFGRMSGPPSASTNAFSPSQDPGSQASPSPVFGSRSSFGKLHFAGYHLGEISSYSGVPHFSLAGREWICSRSGQVPVFPTVWDNDEVDHGAPQLDKEDVLPPVDEPSLPDRAVTDQYLAFFSTSHFRLVFPVLDTVLFRKIVDTAYGLGTSVSHEFVAAKTCVFAFLCMVTLFVGPESPVVPPVDGDVMAAKAQHLLPAALRGDFTLTSLQTMIMLTMYQLFAGRVQSSLICLSLACRIMFMLGAHTLANPWSSSSPEARAPKLLRRLFWLTYNFDKELSLRTGQPPCIPDEHCDLSLPPNYAQTQYLDRSMQIDLDDETMIPTLPGDLGLTLIKSKTCQLLYSAEALRKTDAELLRNIRELDDELEKWRLSVPLKHRPALSISRDVGVNQALSEAHDSVRTIVINFEYHYLIATIHRATGRCRAWGPHNGPVPGEEMKGVSSSLALSVEASRSTLLFLRSALPVLLAPEVFCMMLFYPMSAVLTIFCSILLDPLGPQAADDVVLLNSAPEMIKNMRIKQIAKNEMLQLKLVEEFITELSRLSQCAIVEAVRKQGVMDTNG